MQTALAKGIRLFNEHKFFEAHETLEEIWLQEQGEAKILLHGLIQIAAAFHHAMRANMRGFDSLLKKGRAKLDRYPPAVRGIDLVSFRQDLTTWSLFSVSLEQSPEAQPPPWPLIRRT